MKFPGAKRRPPFVTLPRHKRSHEVIRLKGKMRRDAAEYGGRFTSRLVLNEPGRPDLYNQWFDFYFPGTDRFTIWNASFVTARKAFWDKAHDLAHTRVGAMLTPEEREENSNWEFVPAQRSSTGKILTYKLAEREEMRFEQFGGLTFHEQWRKLEFATSLEGERLLAALRRRDPLTLLPDTLHGALPGLASTPAPISTT